MKNLSKSKNAKIGIYIGGGLLVAFLLYKAYGEYQKKQQQAMQ